MLEEIYSRRSIRKYTNEPISCSIIEKIIDAGRVAPSAKNRQPWKYLVYSGEAKARLLSIMKKGIEMEEINPRLPLSVNGIPDAKNTLRIMETAPVVIVVLNTNGKSPFIQLDADDRFTEMNDLLSIGASIENIFGADCHIDSAFGGEDYLSATGNAGEMLSYQDPLAHAYEFNSNPFDITRG